MSLGNHLSTLAIGDGTAADIRDILELDSKVYSPEWRVSEEYIRQILSINPGTWRVARVHGRVAGYYALLPLQNPGFSHYLKGRIGDNECIDYVVPFESDVTCSVIFNSIVVDPLNSMAKTLAAPKEICTSLSSVR